MSENASHKQTIWIVRHGNRMDFADHEWRSRAERPEDPPLAPDGVIQAKELAQRLRGEGIQRIFASPFHRTVETAQFIADALDLPINIENGICECFRAEWYPFTPRLRSPREMKELFPSVNLSYEPQPFPDYPEDDEQLQTRLTRMGHYLAEKYADEDFIIVGHGGTVCGVTNGFMGTEGEVHTPLCCLVKIARQESGWHLELFADTSHLSNTDDGTRMN